MIKGTAGDTRGEQMRQTPASWKSCGDGDALGIHRCWRTFMAMLICVFLWRPTTMTAQISDNHGMSQVNLTVLFQSFACEPIRGASSAGWGGAPFNYWFLFSIFKLVLGDTSCLNSLWKLKSASSSLVNE